MLIARRDQRVLGGPPERPALPPGTPLMTYDERDLEAAARMLASENPRGSEQLHVEQIFSQVRQARRHRQSLYDRITAGEGYGVQNKRRPVSTHNEARPRDRALARRVLDGELPSRMLGATKFFEPEQQDRAFAIAERARAKRTAGQPLTDQEKRLLGYEKNAATVRAEWSADHTHAIDSIDGVEFWT